ncbi:MAG TPA: sigma 54-interacting transcriptional regulator [Gemmatimonadales bacterium]|nr:sigma 54-interacting transcriptional regulator [Gemmatimonadales bacterium]
MGESPELDQVLDAARRVAGTDASVFITGESGTGKELVAQYVHQHSARRDRPFVAVNCAALPETLFESELFGHRRGAFTGAFRDKPGILEAAHRGTVFLDELLDMPKAIQAKLLRVLQDGIVRRVGSETPDAEVDVRVICATNRDPEAAIRSGELREDLFYRLHVVPIHLPPLRDRPADIPALVAHFLELHWRRHRGATPRPVLSPEARWALAAHPWRGNVRELQNTIEHLVVLVEPGATIHPDRIPFRKEPPPGEQGPGALTSVPVGLFSDGYQAARQRVLEEFETRYLEWFVQRAGGNFARAARMAGIDRTTVYRLLQRQGQPGSRARRGT